MTKKYKVFIFDFDGTLADSRLNIANSLNAALTKNNFSPIEKGKIYPLIGRKKLEKAFLTFYPDLPETLMPKLIADFREHQLTYLKDEMQLFTNVAQVLEILHSRDKSLSILTTKGTEQITKMLEILKIKHFFDVIYGRDLPYGEKPNKQCVDYMLSQLPNKFTKEQVVIVGDTEIDLQTAQNSGVDFIAVTYGIGSREELALAGAKRFIDSFDQILKYS